MSTENPEKETELEEIQWTTPTGKHHVADSASITDNSPPPEDFEIEDFRPDLPPKPPEPKKEEKRGPGRPRLAIAPPPKTAKEPPGEKIPPPKVSIPSFSEWHDYLGNFVIKWITRGYIAMVFRGVDRWELLTPQDNEALELDDQSLSDIAKPLAHIANRSKLGRKHGRMLIDSSDGVAAAIQLAMWANRVNRIARKYRPEKGQHEHRVVRGESERISEERPGQSGGNVPEGPPQPAYSGNGQAPSGFGYN